MGHIFGWPHRPKLSFRTWFGLDWHSIFISIIYSVSIIPGGFTGSIIKWEKWTLQEAGFIFKPMLPGGSSCYEFPKEPIIRLVALPAGGPLLVFSFSLINTSGTWFCYI